MHPTRFVPCPAHTSKVWRRYPVATSALLAAFHIPELTGCHDSKVPDLLQLDDFFVAGYENVRATIESRGYDGNIGRITKRQCRKRKRICFIGEAVAAVRRVPLRYGYGRFGDWLCRGAGRGLYPAEC